MTAASSSLPAPHLMPLMRYRDLAEAMGWLERAFGFEKQIAVSDSDGEVIYGQMTYRGSLIMMGAVRETDLDKLMRQPDEVGGVETQSCYIVIDDADEHYARAMDAGAEIVLEIKSDGLGRRGYSCRDPQGHIWNFGTYNPGKGLQPLAVHDADDDDQPAPAPRSRSRVAMMAGMLLIAAGVGTWLFSDAIKADLAHRLAQEQTVKAETAYTELAKVRAEKRTADALAVQLQADLKAEKARRQSDVTTATRQQMEQVQKELADLRAARQRAEAEVRTLRAELDRQQAALDAVNEAKRISEEKLAVKTAEEARLREAAAKSKAAAAAAQRASQDRGETAPNREAAEADTAQTSPGSKKLETSATAPVTPQPPQADSAKPVTSAKAEQDDDGEDATDAPATKRTTKRRPQRSRASSTRRKQPPPTYVINLRDVPWPYNAWYK